MSLTGERMLIAMDRRELDQDQLADLVGCTQGAISKIIVGKTRNSRLLPKIAGVLRHPLDWLTGLSDDDGQGEGVEAPFSFEEQQLVEQMRALSASDRNAIATLIRSLSMRIGVGPVQSN